jgi:hypothetical protein
VFDVRTTLPGGQKDSGVEYEMEGDGLFIWVTIMLFDWELPQELV